MDRQWKLGEDMHTTDTILDPITFEQVIDALHCGERVLDAKAIYRVAKEMLDSRIEDFFFLLLNNQNEIIAEAAKGRETV
jgi:DNA repair protein RadC